MSEDQQAQALGSPSRGGGNEYGASQAVDLSSMQSGTFMHGFDANWKLQGIDGYRGEAGVHYMPVPAPPSEHSHFTHTPMPMLAPAGYRPPLPLPYIRNPPGLEAHSRFEAPAVDFVPQQLEGYAQAGTMPSKALQEPSKASMDCLSQLMSHMDTSAMSHPDQEPEAEQPQEHSTPHPALRPHQDLAGSRPLYYAPPVAQWFAPGMASRMMQMNMPMAGMYGTTQYISQPMPLAPPGMQVHGGMHGWAHAACAQAPDGLQPSQPPGSQEPNSEGSTGAPTPMMHPAGRGWALPPGSMPVAMGVYTPVNQYMQWTQGHGGPPAGHMAPHGFPPGMPAPMWPQVQHHMMPAFQVLPGNANEQGAISCPWQPEDKQDADNMRPSLQQQQEHEQKDQQEQQAQQDAAAWQKCQLQQQPKSQSLPSQGEGQDVPDATETLLKHGLQGQQGGPAGLTSEDDPYAHMQMPSVSAHIGSDRVAVMPRVMITPPRPLLPVPSEIAQFGPSGPLAVAGQGSIARACPPPSGLSSRPDVEQLSGRLGAANNASVPPHTVAARGPKHEAQQILREELNTPPAGDTNLAPLPSIGQVHPALKALSAPVPSKQPHGLPPRWQASHGDPAQASGAVSAPLAPRTLARPDLAPGAIDIESLFAQPPHPATSVHPSAPVPLYERRPSSPSPSHQHSSAPERGRLLLQLDGGRKDTRYAPPCGLLPARGLPALDRDCNALFATLDPAPSEMEVLHGACSRLEEVLLADFPDASVCLFGSAASALCVTQNHDIDVTLVTHEGDGMDSEEKGELVERLAHILEAAGMEDVKVHASARVPVVKLREPGTNVAADITINNMLPLYNTGLLRAYAAIDPRARALLFLVKHWAKQRGLNNTYEGTLSSYAWCLMAVFIAQRARLLPLLQSEPPDVEASVVVEGQMYRVAYARDADRHRAAAAAHPLGLGGLLTMFFDYYAFRFDFNKEVVCITEGRTKAKGDLGWIKRIGKDRHHCCIQDPFLTSHDLGRCVDKESRALLEWELRRAADIMYRNAADPLRELMTSYEQERSRGVSRRSSGSGGSRARGSQNERAGPAHGAPVRTTQPAGPLETGRRGFRGQKSAGVLGGKRQQWIDQRAPNGLPTAPTV